MVLFGDVLEFVVDVLELFGGVELTRRAATARATDGGPKKTKTYNSKMEFHF